MNGINLSDPHFFRDLVEGFRTALGTQVVEIHNRSYQNSPDTGIAVIKHFNRVPEWLNFLQVQTEPPDVGALVDFSYTAYLVREAAALENAGPWLRTLREKVRTGNIEQFLDSIFEAETALYWRDQLRALRVKFGPKRWPDVWVTLNIGPNEVPVAVECKRIRESVEERLRSSFAEKLEQKFNHSSEGAVPLKTIVWLHRSTRKGDELAIAGAIRRLAGRITDTTDDLTWYTVSDSDGDYQVSLAPLGPTGEFQEPMLNISDVPPHPVLVSRSELNVVSQEKILVRFTSILSVRSDQARDPVGNLLTHFEKASRQSKRAYEALTPPTSGEIGSVAIRLRPPRTQGDLFEAEALIRDALKRPEHDHIALVTLFWDESERQENPLEFDGVPATEKIHARHLKPYFIPNNRSGLNCSQLDSRPQYFPDTPSALVRDPASGSLQPIDAELLVTLASGSDLPPELQEALENVEALNEEHDAVTVYVHLLEPLSLGRQEPALVGFFSAGRRSFRTFIDRDFHLVTYEYAAGRPIAAATIDLRAWVGVEELCWSVEWTREHYRVGVSLPDESGRVYARFSDILQQIPGYLADLALRPPR